MLATLVGPPKTRSNGERIILVLKLVSVADTVLVLIIETSGSKGMPYEDKNGNQTQA